LIGSWYEIESLVKEGIDVQESPVLGFLIDEAIKGLVSVHRFRVQRSAPPLTAEAVSLIEKETPALRSHIRGLGAGTKLKTRSLRKKCWFCHIIAKCHVPDLWGCGSGRFSRTKHLQNDVW